MRAMVLFLSVCAVLTVSLAAYAADTASPEKGGVRPWEQSDLWSWTVRKERPRIYLDAERLAAVRKKIEGKSLDEVKALSGSSSEGLALVYALTGDQASGRAAIDRVISIADKGRYSQAPALAVVYDWCYPLLTDSERARAREWMAATLKSEMAFSRTWRSFHNAAYSHAYAAGFAAIALAHDDPVADDALRFLSAEMRDAMKVFDILFPDGEWAEGHDYDRVSTYPAFRLLWAVKTATGKDLMADSPHMRNTALYTMYAARPDGLVYSGDDNDHPCITDLDREMLLMAAAEYKDPYAQYFLNHCDVEMFLPTGRNRWRELLWHDSALAERPLEESARLAHLPGQGARHGSERLGLGRRQACPPGHVGHVQVLPLLRRPHSLRQRPVRHLLQRRVGHRLRPLRRRLGHGARGREVRKSQFFNYYQRTIAHNTILVYDPDEKFERRRGE